MSPRNSVGSQKELQTSSIDTAVTMLACNIYGMRILWLVSCCCRGAYAAYVVCCFLFACLSLLVMLLYPFSRVVGLIWWLVGCLVCECLWSCRAVVVVVVAVGLGVVGLGDNICPIVPKLSQHCGPRSVLVCSQDYIGNSSYRIPLGSHLENYLLSKFTTEK